MTVEELQVLVTAKTQGLQTQMSNVTKQLQGVQKQTNTMSNNMTATFRKLKTTLVALGIGKAIAESFNMARTYEASVQQVNRLYGAYSGAMDSWIAKNAATFGMARADAMKYASTYGNLLSGFLGSQEEMSTRTQDLLKVTSIVAASTGRTVTDVSERIRSGLLGNTESIEDLGINVNVALLQTSNAFKQLANGKTWNQLSFQTQQQIRLMAILEQASAKFGDNIQQNTNYQLMQLTANLKNIGLNIGQAFMPIVSVVLPVLNAMALALSNVTAKIATFMNALFGTNFTAGAGEVAQVGVDTGDAANGFGSMADNADAAGESAKKAGKAAKNALAGFDEINSLSKDSGSDASGDDTTNKVASTSVAPVTSALESATETFAEKLKAEMEKLKGLFKKGFEIGLGGDYQSKLDSIRASIQGIKESVKNIFTNQDVKSSFSNWIDGWVLAYGKIYGSMASVGTTIAQNLLGGINKYLDQNKQYIKDRIVGILDASSEIANLVGNFSVAFADVFSVFGGETGQQITANIIGMFSNGFLGVTELAMKFSVDVIEMIVRPFTENKDRIADAIQGSLEVVEIATGTLKDVITNTMEKVLDVYDEYLSPAFDNITDGIGLIVGAVVDSYSKYIQPTLAKMADAWNKVYTDSIKPMVDKALVVLGKLVDMVSVLWKEMLAPFLAWLTDLWGPGIAMGFEVVSSIFAVVVSAIADLVTGLLQILEGIIDFMMGVFTGDWDRAWQGIKGIFKGVADTLYGLTIGPLEKILGWVKNTFALGWKTAWEGMGKVFKGVFDGLVYLAKIPLNFVIDMINKVIGGINKVASSASKIPGVNISNIREIPRLARGGIVDGATFMGNYIAGEAGKEMIVPLENTSFVSTLASALGNAVMNAMSIGNNYNNGNGTSNVSLEMEGTVFARSVTPYIIKEMKRLGFDL